MVSTPRALDFRDAIAQDYSISRCPSGQVCAEEGLRPHPLDEMAPGPAESTMLVFGYRWSIGRRPHPVRRFTFTRTACRKHRKAERPRSALRGTRTTILELARRWTCCAIETVRYNIHSPHVMHNETLSSSLFCCRLILHSPSVTDDILLSCRPSSCSTRTCY